VTTIESQREEGVIDARMESVPQMDRPLAQRFSQVVEAWRGLLDEIRVQAELAGMGLRDDVAGRRRLGENVWIAARVHLDHAVYDATHGTAVYHPAASVIRDLRRAATAASGAARRG
jgi:hypothetical protein